MRCEVCGRHIRGRSYKAIIEGARLVVCNDCSILGSMSWEVKAKRPNRLSNQRQPHLRKKLQASKKRQSPLEPSSELVEDFGTRIREARETQKLSHKGLGERINEKASVLKKLESYKMVPDNKLAKKLQHVLKIRLLRPKAIEKPPKKLLAVSPASKAITLGDLLEKEGRE